nr:hypothetical protein [Tanacetum cinerariifolium]GFA40840.1 hypothetical protein [Tanacetum cinerariifolium]
PDYVPGPEHADDEIVAEDQPYAKDASPTALSPEYVLESDLEAYLEEDDNEDPEEDPVDYPVDGGDHGDDEEGLSEDDDMDIETDEKEEEEEHPAPADSVVVALPADDQALSAKETEPFKTDESAATPPPHPAYRITARISIPAPVPVPAWSDSEVVRLLSMSSLPSSKLSPLSSPPPQIPFPPLPPILSPPSPVLSSAPPPSPIHSWGYRAAMIRLRAEAASTSHSPSLPPSFILSPTRSDAPSSGIPPPLPISTPTSSPPLQLPFASHKEDRPERLSYPERLGYNRWMRVILPTVRRQIVTSKMLRADHRRSVEIRGLRISYPTASAYTDIDSDADTTGTCDHTTGTSDSPTRIGDSLIGTGYRTTGTAGTRWRMVKKMAPKRTIGAIADQETTNTTSVTNAQLQAMIDQGVTAALAAPNALKSTNDDDSHHSRTGVRRTE